jgi:hypothetical protein
MCSDCIAKGDGAHCEICAKARRVSRARMKRGFLIAAAPITVGVVLLFYLGRQSASDRAAQQAASPPAPEAKIACDRQAVVEAADGFIRMHEPQKTLDLADKFFRQCGELPRLHWATYAAHKQLSDWSGAVGDATALIASRPGDKDFWWWRAAVQEKQSHEVEAAADYRQAIANEPQLTNIPVNLFQVYQDLKRPCDALVTLARYVEVHPELKNSREIQRRMSDARLAGGGCPGIAGVGTGTFAVGIDGLARTDGSAVGAHEQPSGFIIDEASSYVVLSSAYAYKLGVQGETPVDIVLGGTVRRGKLATLKKLEIGSTHASDVEVVIIEHIPVASVDGVVGGSYLWRFTTAPSNRGISLRPRALN